MGFSREIAFARTFAQSIDIDDLDGEMPACAPEVVVAERGDVAVTQLADRQNDDLHPSERAVKGVGLTDVRFRRNVHCPCPGPDRSRNTRVHNHYERTSMRFESSPKLS